MCGLSLELTDCIIDLLYDDPDAIKRVSLVSKARFDRSRHRLFVMLSVECFKLTDLGFADLPPMRGGSSLSWTSDPVTASSIEPLQRAKNPQPHHPFVSSISFWPIEPATMFLHLPPRGGHFHGVLESVLSTTYVIDPHFPLSEPPRIRANFISYYVVLR